MKDTLKKADGAGLAAPQVGILRRVVIVRDEDEKILTLVNPEIISEKGDQEATEGCLSVPGIWGITHRPAEVTVKAFDEKGKEHIYTRKGMVAVCFCHEIDHLDGILFREHVEKYIDMEK